MEFSEEFALIQGSLISLQNTLGDLKFLSLDEGHDVKIKSITDAIQKTIAGMGINSESGVSTEQDLCLRRIHLFLVLNTKLHIQEKLLNDINCGHIVDCAPNLSKDLLLELVCKLSLHKYMYETIIYCPLLLCVELLDAILNRICSLEPFEALLIIEEVSKAVYIKYVRLETQKEADNSSARAKLFNYFKDLLQYFIKPNLTGMNTASRDDLYRYAGFAMRSLLSVMIRCLTLHLNPEDCNEEAHEVYDISLPEFCDTDEVEIISSLNFINELLSVCKVNLLAITVDVWLFWAEFTVDDGKTLQNIIGEAMYDCSEKLKKAENGKVVFQRAEEVASMLSSMAIKPRDEDDEIKEADVESIVRNVSDNTKSRKKWFKALINLNGLMTDEICVLCLKKNTDLADYDDVKLILLKTSALPGYDERIKLVGLDLIKSLPLDKQVDIVVWYFQTFGLSNNFMTENFHLMNTEVFNKAINVPASEKKDKFLSEFVCLCMQSPEDVISKVLHEAQINCKQTTLMVKILKCLNPICNISKEESVGHIKMPLLICILNESVRKSHPSDQEISNLVRFVVALVDENVIDDDVFIKQCLLPALSDSLNATNWTLLLLWLKILHSFTDGTLKSRVDISHCPLVVMLAQVVEVSRWNLLTFCSSAASVCEEALGIVEEVMQRFLDTKSTEDKEVKWLQIKLAGFLSPLNLSYFNKLWTKFGREWTSLTVDSLVLDIMQRCDGTNRKAAELFQDIENKEHLFLISFSKLLPLCTTAEWKMLAQNMEEMKIIWADEPAWLVKHTNLFTDSALLVLHGIKHIESNEFTLSCLDYFIRNLGLILKEQIIPQLKHRPHEEQVKVVVKMVHVLGRLPPGVKDPCSAVIVNVFIDLLSEIFNVSELDDEGNKFNCSERMSMLDDIVTNIGILGSGESVQILARKLLGCLE